MRGVVSVHNTIAHGPGSRGTYQEEAERVVGFCGDGVPCIPGAERPMEHREDLVPSAGLELMVEEARQGPLTVIATGPATDVASLALAAPETRDNVRVVWLGGFGGKDLYERHKIHELNGRADIAAWRGLFEGRTDLLLVPGWPAPAKMAEILQRWVVEYSGDVDPEGEKILWDVACVAAVADPEAATVEGTELPTLDAAGSHDYSQPGREVGMVDDLDEGRVISSLMGALGRLPDGGRS